MPDLIKRLFFLLCGIVLLTGCASSCASSRVNERTSGDIPVSLTGYFNRDGNPEGFFKVDGEPDSKVFRILKMKPEGDWMTLIVERQDVSNPRQDNMDLWDIATARIRLNCTGQEMVLSQGFKPTVQEMAAQPPVTRVESFSSAAPFWRDLAQTVCAAYLNPIK